jgi:Mn2+/Fe2+ NRAMP family transporter
MSKLGITSAIGWALAQPTGAGPSARLVLPKRFNPPVLVSASGNLRFVQTHRGITPGAPKIAGPVDPLLTEPEQAPRAFTRIRLDTYFGMGISNLVALAIIVTTAATLHANGMTDIQTSQQAAEALRPLAGRFAFLIFALGIIGTGFLAVPVLAGSAAYAIGEARKWPVGLARKPMEAKAFYCTLAVATVVGTIINFMPVDPVKALYWSAVINGIMAPRRHGPVAAISTA